MNYLKIYNDLINRAKNRPYFSPCEIHHIIPKSLGGSNNADNLIALTPKEHCIAHMLLRKIYPNSTEMKKAYNFMCKKGSFQYVKTRKSVIQKLSHIARTNASEILQIELKTFKVLNIFNSPSDAAESITGKYSKCLRKNDLISTCARLNHSSNDHTSLGYIWKYN